MPSSTSDSDLLAQRYGRTGRTTRPPWLLAAVVLLATVGVAWVAWATWSNANREATGQLRTYDVRSDTATEVTVVVDRRTGTAVECDVFAQAADHSRVGELVFRVPAGEPGALVVTETITTQRRAANGVLGECAAVD